MLDTDRHARWVAMLASSDTVLVQLALLSVAALFVWERLRSMPEPWRGRMRLVYMAGALGYLLVQLVTTRGTLYVLLTAMAISIVARAVWAYRQRRIGPMAQQEKTHASN